MNENRHHAVACTLQRPSFDLSAKNNNFIRTTNSFSIKLTSNE